MRQSLMHSFDDIYLLDLHGNSKKKEKALDGGKDENVFDIQQGVAIGLFVKCDKAQDKPAQVYHADLYGTRESKYAGLAENDVSTTQWKSLQPQEPFYLFVPQDTALLPEYEQGWKITDIMPINSTGIVTARDHFVIDFEDAPLKSRIKEFIDLSIDNNEIRQKYFSGKGASIYDAGDTRGWKLPNARRKLAEENWKLYLRKVLYRPFDMRSILYTPLMVDWPRPEVMRHILVGENLALNVTRLTKDKWDVSVSNCIIGHKALSAYDITSMIPLYLYPSAKTDLFDDSTPGKRRANLVPEFIADFSARLQLDFVPDGCGDLRKSFGPEDVFHYAYAVFHSPTYRSRYAEFLKIDFPRLPLTRDVALFRNLCASGKELVALHLMEHLPKLETRYPEAGDNTVDAVRYTEPTSGVRGRVWINQTQYFDNVPPEVWDYHIGGYQVCQKWLKDRKGRQLSYDDLTHYRGIVAALARTIELQAAIDDAIGEWPLQ